MKLIHVAAAAIEDNQGRILITKRHDQVHQGGLWEFPGGKLEPGEAAIDGLLRELQEELGITPLHPEPLIQITHHYDDRSVLLEVYRVKDYMGLPQGMEGQPLEWLSPQFMQAEKFPAADRPVINALQLPDLCLITGADPYQRNQFLGRLESALGDGVRLVQLRAHPLPDDEYRKLAEAARVLCQEYGAYLLLNRPEQIEAWIGQADGIHLTRHQLMSMQNRPLGACWIGASCHDPMELQHAERLGLDYALLSPVQPTASHPDSKPLGWKRFTQWVKQANLPVYALGGMSRENLDQAKHNGAQGIAGIRGLWSNG